MGRLTEATFTELVTAGCAACAGRSKLEVRAYVEGRTPLLGGEAFGPTVWVYKGETFVDGVYEIACATCRDKLFACDLCPRCHGEAGLATALESENAWPVPPACPRCGNERVEYVAFVPAHVRYEGKRADKARTHTDLADPGFHGVRVECKDCKNVLERRDGCPLCDAPGPIRPRPS